jgi:hypothetical protein
MGLERLGSILPEPARRGWHEAVWFQRRLTRRLRALPDFIIIGAQRCGTTSLHRYLERHPRVAPAARKEIHYFDDHWREGELWYRTYFPSVLHRKFPRGIRRRAILTGEASPYYVFHPHAAKRVLETVPAVKLILMLRNPVDRAWSQYHHEVRWGFEKLTTFEDAIDKEPERLAGELERMLEDEDHVSFAHNHFSYLARGLYLDQIRTWRRYFPDERMLIVRSEDFYEDTRRVFREVLGFLELPEWDAGSYPRHNKASYREMAPATRERLVRWYRPRNEDLYRFLDRDFGWDE